MRTPILEFTELHERKSGAGIVSKLFELAGGGSAGICLRPELTASIVRAYAEAAECPPLPWRVSSSGPVFRYESDPAPAGCREFTQVGVELIGAAGPAADAEVIGLADRSLASAGIADATIRIGHVGLILEILGHAGLPPRRPSALVEMLSAAAAEGKGIQAIESALDRLAGWLRPRGRRRGDRRRRSSHADDRGVDRLFRHLVPDVTGRRSGHEIIDRLRRKWDLGHSLSRDPRTGARPGPRPGRAARAGPADARRLERRTSPRSRPNRSPTCARCVGQLGHHGVDSGPGRARPGFRPGDRLLHPDDLRARGRRPRRARSRSAAAAATTAWPASWAAIATTAASGSPSGWNGCTRF